MPGGRIMVSALLAAMLAAAVAAWGSTATVAPGLRLAVFPPVLTRVEAFRTIILGNARPVAETPIPGVWLIHVDPAEPADVRGALVTGVGPFIRLASAACLTVADTSR